MSTSINVGDIVTYLLTQSIITNVVWTNIYFGEPIWEKTWISLILNVITQTPHPVTREARVEFRFVWNDINVTKQSLIDLQDIVTENIVYASECWLKNFNWFYVYHVEEWEVFTLLLDEKRRNYLIKDYIFKWIRN